MASTGGGVASTAVVSGVFAALVAVAVTRAIELLGGQLGGVVATLPTTIVPASYGIAALAGIPLLAAAPASARPELVVAALYAFPAGTLVSSGFLAVWRLLPPALPQRWPMRVALPVMVVTSLSTWASCAALAVALARAATAPRAFGLACFAAQAALGISSTVRHRAAPRGAGAVPLRLLLLRGGLAGAVICFAVLLAAAAGDGGVAAGVATAFPVIFLTIQVSLWLGHDGTGQDGQGKAVQGGAVGPMMLGSLAVPAYSMIFAELAVFFGIAGAMAAAWLLAALFVSLPALAWLRWRAAVSAAEAAAHAAATEAAPAAAAAAAADAAAPSAAEIVAIAAAPAAAASAAEAEPGLLAEGPATWSDDVVDGGEAAAAAPGAADVR